jgi:hypothetical protein
MVTYHPVSGGRCKILRGKSTLWRKVQNSAWKIDPLEEGAKFYVENRPSGGRCKILRGKSTLSTMHSLHYINNLIPNITTQGITQ